MASLLIAGCAGDPASHEQSNTTQQPVERQGSYDVVSAQDRSRVRWTATVGGVPRVGQVTQIVGGLYLVGDELEGASGVISANLRYVETGQPLWDKQIAESFFEVLTAGKEKVHVRVSKIQLVKAEAGEVARLGEAWVDIMFARGSTSQRLAVEASQRGDSWLIRSTAPNVINLNSLGYGERLLDLSSALAVESIAPTLRFEFELYLESMRADLAPPAGPLLRSEPFSATEAVEAAESQGAVDDDNRVESADGVVCPAGMVPIAGGRFELGESDEGLLASYAPDRILPRSSFHLAGYCVALHPFPGRPGLPWPSDGLSVDALPEVEALLVRHGRRLCTVPELTLAAAGPENHRYPWHASERRKSDCEQDDVRPSSLGSRPMCRSSVGLWDLQVRSSWVRMDEATRGVLTRPTDETSPGHDSLYWLWGANARDDTYYAPSNFGLHHHLAGSKAYQDDGLRVCAGPGGVTKEQQEAWDALIERYLPQGSFAVLRAER